MQAVEVPLSDVRTPVNQFPSFPCSLKGGLFDGQYRRIFQKRRPFTRLVSAERQLASIDTLFRKHTN